MLVVIGPRWLTVEEPDGGRRIENELDFVRLEIESALQGDAEIVPLLVDNARMPTARELPAPIAGLADRAALELSDGRNWAADADRVVATIREILSPASSSPSFVAALPGEGRRWTVRPAMIVAICVLLIVAGISFVALIAPGDDRLRIYSSLPLRDGEGNPSKRVSDMEKAMSLALKQKLEQGMAGDLEVVYEPLDSSDESGDTPASLVEGNARKAARDDRTAAYLGDFNSGDSQKSIPILNEEGVAMISPASTRTGLTAKDERGDLGEPGDYYPKRYRNFARVIPNDIVQAKALLELMLSPRPHPCTKLAVVDDASPYGRGLSNDILAYNGGRLEIKFRQSVDENGAFAYLVEQAAHRGVDCFVFSGVKRAHTIEMFEAFATVRGDVRLFGTDALADPGFYASPEWSSDAVAGRVSIMVPPRSSTRYNEFRDAFVAEYGSVPELYAVYGYEAMLVALDAIERSGTGRREDVVKALFETPRRRSALGSYRFNDDGDTTLGRYAWSRIVDGRLTTPRPTPQIPR